MNISPFPYILCESDYIDLNLEEITTFASTINIDQLHDFTVVVDVGASNEHQLPVRTVDYNCVFYSNFSKYKQWVTEYPLKNNY